MILYKKDTKGNIRYLNIYNNGAELIQESGILNTDKPIIHIKTCKSKNIGKSNETTPEEQASNEVNSLIKDKLTEGYFKSIEECNTAIVILPMLAKNYHDEVHKINWNYPVYIQPKLDGMRCLAHIKKNGDVDLISRDGKIIQNMMHIKNELTSIKQDIILDGELYCHGLSFQENMKLIKKYRPNETEKIKFHIYDIVNDKCFTERNPKQYTNGKTHLIEVPTIPLTDVESIIVYNSNFIAEGYEGSIIRHGNSPYKTNGRSDSVLKYKDFQDIVAEIIDVEPGEQRPEWGVPVLKYYNQKMSGIVEFIFRAGTRLSHEDRKDLLKNKHEYIGQKAEIRFFEYSDDGIPRFPVMVGIRLDK